MGNSELVTGKPQLENRTARPDADRRSFDRFRKLRAGEPEWMSALRERSWDRFARMEWPTPQEEEWRRTDITGIDFSAYPADDGRRDDRAGTEGARRKRAAAESGTAGRLRFYGPACVSAGLSASLEERGVFFAPLREAMDVYPDLLRQVLFSEIDSSDNRLLAWHYAFLSQGAFLYVPRFVEISDPFRLEFLESPEAKRAVFPHVFVILEEGARASVVQRIGGKGGEGVLCNAGSTLRIADAGGLEYFSLQELDESSLYFSHDTAQVGRDGSLRRFDAVFGGGLSKVRAGCNLAGSGADVLMSGAYFSRSSQHQDIRSEQRHVAPSANSRAYYKGAVMDGARTVYQGMIEVAPGAAKTDAYLTNRNLILNDGARADSIPSLRIDNNDVKCSHGSTTGRINEEELFYLMSRGLSRGEAREMLVQGYFEELFAQVPSDLGAEMRRLVEDRLAGVNGGEER